MKIIINKWRRDDAAITANAKREFNQQPKELGDDRSRVMRRDNNGRAERSIVLLAWPPPPHSVLCSRPRI